ncbi:hypothetical protein [Catenuloplanes indicus]|uniref:Uncharacterized protein n=1 Tax=Catenuloplanes indicus TaxID=137267 RepID=A0AAE4B0W6_9ACTN|nr:hypothetical protein [Catenuloplanes indicus]MDQ0369977.1 hypothetical protein [Catenuloplanes indicus]
MSALPVVARASHVAGLASMPAVQAVVLVIRAFRSPPRADTQDDLPSVPGIEDPGVVVARFARVEAASSGVRFSHRTSKPATAAPHARNIAILGGEAPGGSPPARREGGAASPE